MNEWAASNKFVKILLCHSLPAQYADSVDFKDGLLNSRFCTVKFPAVKSYFSRDTTHTEVPSTRMDMEV